jgi:hypothetical protein
MKFKHGDKVVVFFEAEAVHPDSGTDEWSPGCICGFNKDEKRRVDFNYLKGVIKAGGTVLKVKKSK